MLNDRLNIKIFYILGISKKHYNFFNIKIIYYLHHKILWTK